MNIRLKHNLKCIDCQYQKKINELCKGRPYGIEWDYFKEAGDVHIDPIYTIHFQDERIRMVAVPLEVKKYKVGVPFSLINRLSKSGLKQLIEEADRLLIKKNKN